MNYARISPDLAETARSAKRLGRRMAALRPLNPTRTFRVRPPLPCYDPRGVASRMSGRGYTVFDLRSADAASHGASWAFWCAIAGGRARSKPRLRLFQLFPDARELRPPGYPERHRRNRGRWLRRQDVRFLRGRLDMTAIRARSTAGSMTSPDHPRGETPDLWRGRSQAQASGAGAFGWRKGAWRRNPFMLIRAVPSRARGGGYADRISPTAAAFQNAGCCRSEGPAARAARRCSTVLLPCCSAAPAGLKSAHDGHTDPARRQDLRYGLPVHRRAGLQSRSFEQPHSHSIALCAQGQFWLHQAAGARSSW